MSEDPRIGEFRAELDRWEGNGPRWVRDHGLDWILDRFRAILDRPAADCELRPDPQLVSAESVERLKSIRSRDVLEGVDWEAAAEAFADEIADLNPPAPRVFFPGDTVPAGMLTVDHRGSVTRCTFAQASNWTQVEVTGVPSTEEWQATVDRARAERESA